MDISKVDGDEHCYLNTVKQGKVLYSILDQKRAECKGETRVTSE